MLWGKFRVVHVHPLAKPLRADLFSKGAPKFEVTKVTTKYKKNQTKLEIIFKLI